MQSVIKCLVKEKYDQCIMLVFNNLGLIKEEFLRFVNKFICVDEWMAYLKEKSLFSIDLLCLKSRM